MGLAVTCHLYFGQNDQDLLSATVVTDAKIIAQKVDPGEEHFPAAFARTQTGAWFSATELSPLVTRPSTNKLDIYTDSCDLW